MAKGIGILKTSGKLTIDFVDVSVFEWQGFEKLAKTVWIQPAVEQP